VVILKLCTKESEVNDPLDSNSVFSILGYKTNWILGYVGLELFRSWWL